ncbi:MAG: glucosamine-6-phosphate deaminase [Vicinamibacterales bacterium]
MNLLRFDSTAAWVSGVASFWRDRLRSHPELTICLPTGATPAPVYAEMVRSVEAGLGSFAATHIFALDEFGGLAPNDPGLARNILPQTLLNSVRLPPERFFSLDVWAPDLDRVCAEYDERIAGGFDLVILGIGLNGHLGMNEPGSAADSPTRRVQLHPTTVQSSARYFTHGNLPRWGLTVGLGPILGSHEVWVLATGSSKANIIREAVRRDIGVTIPASLLRRHPNCSFFVDADAGALL